MGTAQQVKDDLLSAKQMQRLMHKKQSTYLEAYINEIEEINAPAASA